MRFDTSLPIMGEVYIFILMCSFDIIEIPFDTSLPIVEEVFICRLSLQNFDIFLPDTILIKKTKVLDAL